jgi:translation initiation factor IF-2
MSKIKIYELAKELDRSSKDIISFLKEKGIEVKSHMNSIEDDVVRMVRDKYQAQNPTKANEPAKKVETTTTNASSSHDQRMNNNRQNNQRNNGNTGSQGYNRNDNRNNNRNDNRSNNNKNDIRNNNNRNDNRNDNRNMNNNNTNNNMTNNNNDNRSNNRFNNQNDNRGNYNNRTNDNRGNRTNDNRNNNQNNNSNNNQNNNSNNNQNKNSNNNQNNNSSNNHNNNRNNRFDNRNNNRNDNRNNNRNNDKNNNRNTNKNNSNNAAPKKGQFIMPKPAPVQEVEDDGIKTIILPEVLTIKELSDKLKMPAAALVKKLFLQGKVVTINQEITFEEAEEIALEFDVIAELEEKVDVIEELLKEDEEDESLLEKRPPVVCVMGHVDHGKTSLLDTIRKTHVTNNEAGGITQHIGAYVVNVNDEKITFLDTPGHEAFTSMRMRGAQSTDIAILVVAADDGVMPQTVEAINHAKAAGIQIIVAINKIDKPSANIERVKQELTEYELIAEDWGGDTVFVPVSAHTGEGIDQLLEMILLTAEMCELKANPHRKGRGIVIEAELDKGRGPVATVLVQKGILHVGDSIAIGSAYGKVRAMIDDKGRRVKEAGPSTPVEILGLNEVPGAGEIFMATENDKEARSIAEAFIKQSREKLLDDTKSKLSLDGLFSQIQAGNIKELNIIVKADVQGSVEAVKQSLLKLSNDEVAIRIIHGGVGAINESDVILASASNAIIIGFNVRPDNTAKDTADREKVDLRLYRVIYNAIEDIEAAMKGMLDPTFEEQVLGHVEVRQVFKASGLGTIAGSYVLDGKVVRGSQARIIRDGIVIFDGDLASLKRFKDDVKEVAAGYECGLVFEKFNDVKEMDQVEIYTMVEVPRK